MKNLKSYIVSSLLLFLAAVRAQEDSGTPLYAVPLLGLFVTSMIVGIVWLMYKDKFKESMQQ